VEPTSSSNKETIIAIKTFVDAVSLPATDINAYLTNSGMTYITQATIGNGVLFVTVSNCFSATYDNYKIIFQPKAGTVANEQMSLELNGLTTGYYGSALIHSYTGSPDVYLNANAQARWPVGYTSTTSEAVYHVDVYQPFDSTRNTSFTGNFFAFGFTGFNGGQTVSTISVTGFKFSNLTNSMTGGTVTVFGYRKS